MRSKEGIQQMEEAREGWKEFFNKVLNRPAPADTTALNGACDELEIGVRPATHAEVRAAMQQVKNGVDGLTIELMKADLKTSVTEVSELFLKIWESEKVPNDWRCGLISRLLKKGNLMECGN